MKKNLLTLGLVVASAVALGGYSYAAQSVGTSSTATSTSTNTIGQWRTKIANKKAGKTASSTTENGKGWFGWEMGRGGKGGFGGWFGGEFHGMKQDPAIEAAIKANDYNAFVTAFNADTKKPTDATVPTQDQFNDMVKQYTKHAAKEAAIDANDYNAYVAATTPTQDEFTKIVAEHAQRKAMETAITNKDYAAFVAAFNADTHKPANATVPTQDEFNKMIARKAEKETEKAAQ